MNVFYFVVFCILNFISLVGVSMLIIYIVQKNESSDTSEKMSALKQQEDRLQTILDELSHVATLLYTDIEKKRGSVKQLLSDVNDKITLLGELSRNTQRQYQKEPLIRQQPPTVQEPVLSTSFRKKSVFQRTTEKKDVVAPCNDINERIYTLSDQGFNVIEIAKIVEKQKGEVELILNLREVSKKKPSRKKQVKNATFKK